MNRFFSRFSQWKWLRPGMGVKRWLLLLAGGLILLALAAVRLPRTAGLWRFLDRLPALPLHPAAAIVLLSAAGLALVSLAVYGLNRTLLSAYRRGDQGDVVEVIYRHRRRQRGPKVVAIGGGHGLNTLLRGLKEHTDHITAIVTVADDGGSSGRLRRDLGMLPPGDFRDCIAALSDAEKLTTDLFQYRFANDTALDGHSFGNLYLTAMTAITGSFESALEESSRVLAVRGQVMPSTLMPVMLAAEVLAAGSGEPAAEARAEQLHGQSRIAHTEGRIQRVYLQPEDAPAFPKAIHALLQADLIVIGPGSLYTSVLPNLLVHDLCEAIRSAPALKVYVCNVATQVGETAGYDVTDHVDALTGHVGHDVFSVVLANGNLPEDVSPGGGAEWVRPPSDSWHQARMREQARFPQQARALARTPASYKLILADLVDRQSPWRHDPHKLADALMALIDD